MTVTVVDAETSAGNRVVPVHSHLRGTVERLCRDGFLITGQTVSKHGDRSNALSQRFGKLKSKAGFGRQHVFHSARRTVATMLERAGVSESTAADLLGHDRRGATMSFGLYSGGSSTEQKREAIEKLVY